MLVGLIVLAGRRCSTWVATFPLSDEKASGEGVVQTDQDGLRRGSPVGASHPGQLQPVLRRPREPVALRQVRRVVPADVSACGQRLVRSVTGRCTPIMCA